MGKLYLSLIFRNQTGPHVITSPITEQMVNAAQQAWCDGLVHIGTVDAEGGDVHAAASTLVDALYDYTEGTVSSEPTLAFGKNTFRSTKQGAISYFVGGNTDFPEDTGFARKRWVKVWYDNNAAENGIQIHGDIAITMGNVYLQSSAGDEVMVDKTFVFRRCRDGGLRLCVHKSALPYSPGTLTGRYPGSLRLVGCRACLNPPRIWGNAMKLPRRQFLRAAAGTAVLVSVPRIARPQTYPCPRPGASHRAVCAGWPD